MQHRGPTFGDAGKPGPVFQRHDIHKNEMMLLSSLAERTFHECLETIEPLRPDTPTIVNPVTRPNSTFHHEHIHLRCSLDKAAATLLRRIDLDDVYAAQMGFSEARLLCRFNQRRNSSVMTRHAGLRWVGMPSTLSVISDRDFCGVECGDFFVDPSGRRGWAYTLVSIDHPACPPQEDYIRGWIRLAHVCMETSCSNLVEVISFVQADMKGSTPLFVARHITKQLVRDAQRALVQSVTRPRRSSMSSAHTETSRTWTMDTLECALTSDRITSKSDELKEAPFRQAVSTLIDTQSTHPKRRPTASRRGSTSTLQVCSTCHKSATTPTICKVCDKVSCPPCSLKWSIVYKYDVQVNLCFSCYDGLIVHRGKSTSADIVAPALDTRSA